MTRKNIRRTAPSSSIGRSPNATPAAAFSEEFQRIVLLVGGEAVFADEDDVAGVVDHFCELGIVGCDASDIENDVDTDDAGLALRDLCDDVGEQQARDREGVVVADELFVEINVEDFAGGRFLVLEGDQKIVRPQVQRFREAHRVPGRR